MKIIKFESENFKKLKVISIEPTANTVQITGKNEMGKSSCLDAIWAALGGAEAAKNVKKPIREGQTKAHSKVHLGKETHNIDLVVTRTWTGKGSYITVENSEGAVFKSPQSMLDALRGTLSFDPLEFSNMKESIQRETLIELVDLGIDLKEWELDRRTTYDERTIVNREVTRLEADIFNRSKGLDLESVTLPISIPNLVSKLDKAETAIRRNKTAREKVEDRAEYIETFKENILKDRVKIEDMKTRLLAAEGELEEKKQKLVALEEQHVKLTAETEKVLDPDTDAIKQAIIEAEHSNNLIMRHEALKETEKELENKKAEADKHTATIEKLDKVKAKALKGAVFPVKGLGFDDIGVIFKNIPFSQCSSSERLRVSVAMAIAMNPKLKVIRIMDGSLLDTEHLQIIEDMCKAKDYQLWIEKIADDPGNVGIYIYDGAITAIDGVPVQEEKGEENV